MVIFMFLVECGDGWTLRFFFLLFGVDEVMGEVIDTDVDIDGLGRGGVFSTVPARRIKASRSSRTKSVMDAEEREVENENEDDDDDGDDDDDDDDDEEEEDGDGNNIINDLSVENHNNKKNLPMEKNI